MWQLNKIKKANDSLAFVWTILFIKMCEKKIDEVPWNGPIKDLENIVLFITFLTGVILIFLIMKMNAGSCPHNFK